VIIPVILCGGAGKRLWPASRPHAPKPFLPLVEGRSTFAMALERVSDREVFGKPLIVAGADHRVLLDRALAEADVGAAVVLEPMGRDTAPAIAVAAQRVARDDLIMVLAADHLINDIDGFKATAVSAIPAARAGRIVVFGIRPTAPITGYGYIQPGNDLEGMAGREVARFTEKPDEATASNFVADGYLWNSGMFLMTAGTILDELERHAGDIVTTAGQAIAGASVDQEVIELESRAFAACARISIDFAVMEKTDRAVVVDAAFDWSDLGAWSAVWAAGGADDDGNVRTGDVTLVDTSGTYASSDRLKLGVVGLRDVVVVATDEAILVTSRQNAGQVKELAEAVAAEPEKNIGDFVRHVRPWGNYQSLDVGDGYQVKRLVVSPGRRLSLQKHRHRAEHWTVVAGVAEVTIDDRVFEMHANRSVYIPLGAVHRLANHGSEPVIVIEVQYGDYLGEDDIVRLEDDFGR
jgi:mannose-1-phosphate guanylyltransferase/mannose-6-phosphate isomerase